MSEQRSKVRGGRGSGSSDDNGPRRNATLSEREPVEFLLELRPTTSFNTEKTASALICFTVAVDGMKFEGYGKTKTEAQHEAATAALKALFNIVCTKGLETTEADSDNESIASEISLVGESADQKLKEVSRRDSNLNDVRDQLEKDVFSFLVKECGGCTSLKRFKEMYNSLPEDFDEWLLKKKKILAVYKKEGKPTYIAPFLRDAETCLHELGLGNRKRCQRRNCNYFHVCMWNLNGMCKRGDKCTYGHTFTSGNNKEIKCKLGLNRFRDKEIRTILKCRYPQVCPASHCEANTPEECPFLHVCYNYIRDKCQNSPCSKGHTLDDPHNKWVLSVYGMSRWPRQQLARLKAVVSIHRGPKRNTNEEDTSLEVDNHEKASDSLSSSENYLAEGGDNPIDERVKNYEIEQNKGESKNERSEEVYKTKLERRNRWDKPVEDTEFMAAVTTKNNPKKKPPSTSQSRGMKDIPKICLALNKSSGPCPEKCSRYHTELPYEWQIKIYGEWVCFTSNENQKIEKQYCQLSDTVESETKHDGRDYKIRLNFPDNYGLFIEIDGEPFSGPDRHIIRRLSTKSFADSLEIASSGSFHTQWRWYYKDKADVWIPYEGDDFQSTLELKYLKGQKTYVFTRLNHGLKYRISFSEMQETNLDTQEAQAIRRRPLFISFSDVRAKNYLKSVRVTILHPVPPGWCLWDLAHDFEQVELEQITEEFKKIEKDFFTSMNYKFFRIENIYRVQNKTLWNEYEKRKEFMEFDMKKIESRIEERHLFHGTDSMDECYGICTSNFDLQSSGKNATAYGKGLYFNVSAKHSHSYTMGPRRVMFQAKVLVGRYTKGEESVTSPTTIPNEDHRRYDSCVDNVQNPSIFVVFDRNQSYPAYLIVYKEKLGSSKPFSETSFCTLT
ncbi:protein mono-ADP-ribosyltransferase PARP12-like isoform X3 [Ostrea edulis]|uniref:protein mono-ADP-ribosyltransferase PARP12-like isoform X2 n=1 Tax=Ostrea edulis TaxID=37623 RepID=UPI0024AFBDF1|nr:protein mono-ADP-ribosyltransferase PARP12-like isoform X2 [Ostrea edulis]XP_056007889.1 protein mono-ADP-ribosyltransferase PARP12-like isoform X3 [Ostrea edulis]